MAELKKMKVARLHPPARTMPHTKTTMRTTMTAPPPPVSVHDPSAYEGEGTSPIVPEDDYLEPSETKKKKKGNKGIMIAVAAGAAVLLLSKK